MQVNINTATKHELLKVPQISESRADAILSHRDKIGTFTSLDDLRNVIGFGDTLVEGLKEFLTTGDPEPSEGRKQRPSTTHA